MLFSRISRNVIMVFSVSCLSKLTLQNRVKVQLVISYVVMNYLAVRKMDVPVTTSQNVDRVDGTPHYCQTLTFYSA